MAGSQPPFDPLVWNRHALLTCDEMRRAEDISCARGPLDFYGLMQNAGRAVAQAVMDRYPPCRVAVLCGPGNNGGDGYVAAEALRRAGWTVAVGAMPSNKQPPAAAKARAAWQGATQALTPALFDEADIVIDAMFGTGLQRPLEGETTGLVANLNARKIPVVAADFPSGIDGDTGQVLGAAVQAQTTVTFFRKKLGHVLLPGAALCGETVVAGTGMDESVLEEINPAVAENGFELWQDLLPLPQAGGHKYNRGHALVYGGPVMTGAARLAARAAQRMGAGLVTLAAPESAMPIYAAALESVIVQEAETLDAWRALLNDPKKNIVLIGPGAGLDEAKRPFVLEALAARKPCVLDADALNVFSRAADRLFKALHPACVLTPHEGEFARLFGPMTEADGGKLARTQKAAALAGCIVLLKGSDTVIASPDGYALVNHSAPPWLATAGSGDVLAGMILGLLGPGMPPFAAAAAAAGLHGRIASDFGPGLIAEDIVAGIPAALLRESQRRLKTCQP
ncbi:MAG: NAD(P)H-hydrate dehydratase [Alphaproteobacteria bacterium]|nr:NAD(P)H-hydrate dehydratase [Alphaproteobacteria bacterium]